MAEFTLTGRQAHLLYTLAMANQDLINAAQGVKERADRIIHAAKSAEAVPGFSNALGQSADDVNALTARRKALIEAVFMMEIPASVVEMAISASGKTFFREGETFEVEA